VHAYSVYSVSEGQAPQQVLLGDIMILQRDSMQRTVCKCWIYTI